MAPLVEHIARFAVQDWRTSKVRARSARTQDPMLRTVYLEILFALYEAGGRLHADPECLADTLLLPAEDVARCLPILLQIGRTGRGGLVQEGDEIHNLRVDEDLAAAAAFREAQRRKGHARQQLRLSAGSAAADHRLDPAQPIPKPLPLPLPSPEVSSVEDRSETNQTAGGLSTPSGGSAAGLLFDSGGHAGGGREAENAEVRWRVAQVWEAHVAAWKEYLRRKNGRLPATPPVMNDADIRKPIRDGLLLYDRELLAADARERWRRESKVRAAGIGIFYDLWCTGDDPNGMPKDWKGPYLDHWRPWKKQTGKADPIPRFAERYFSQRDEIEFLRGGTPEGHSEVAVS